MDQQNATMPAEFILMGVTQSAELKLPLFVVFLTIYTITVVGCFLVFDHSVFRLSFPVSFPLVGVEKEYTSKQALFSSTFPFLLFYMLNSYLTEGVKWVLILEASLCI